MAGDVAYWLPILDVRAPTVDRSLKCVVAHVLANGGPSTLRILAEAVREAAQQLTLSGEGRPALDLILLVDLLREQAVARAPRY